MCIIFNIKMKYNFQRSKPVRLTLAVSISCHLASQTVVVEHASHDEYLGEHCLLSRSDIFLIYKTRECSKHDDTNAISPHKWRKRLSNPSQDYVGKYRLCH
jgi:hypothetical protein